MGLSNSFSIVMCLICVCCLMYKVYDFCMAFNKVCCRNGMHLQWDLRNVYMTSQIIFYDFYYMTFVSHLYGFCKTLAGLYESCKQRSEYTFI